MEKKSFNNPDSVMTPPKTKGDIVKIGDGMITRMTYEPGWKWSEHVGPATGKETCELHHVLTVISGRLIVAMDNGTQIEMGPGDVADIPPGHDAWVVGDEPVVGIDAGGLLSLKP